ncbi:hypothetical protein A1Q1_01994 [Trichosporon asahii var. asahii CBS 2479]|uniref:SCP domain-containing protein n=1 Tax=Trichosporon asahii var. asahii (strain ATCC 90039 / CBS 2479 / JCM 2466 / KCTC 7840 / NBRC 103889/ NCYC 2677 / UAMH 7654) TaxID=1186058 RepID=J6EW99_TRIAS|nr:hypothetical protein A1Q1_01994 [Trichosporon asahii var. asahii CBS 2479]EJT48899.1 hypothetical protein A1Q1_01994 [Trichosporon asahii var. asahii CBS 2479]
MRAALIFTLLAGLVSAMPGDDFPSDNGNGNAYANGLQNGNHNGHGNGKGHGRKCKPKQPKPTQSEQPQVSQAPSESAVSPSATEPAVTEPAVTEPAVTEVPSSSEAAESSAASETPSETEPAVSQSFTSSAPASSAPASSALAESAPAEASSSEATPVESSAEPSPTEAAPTEPAPADPQPTESNFSMNDMKVGEPVTEPARELLQLHNDERAKYGASALEWDDGLAASAAEWASQCVWQHSGPGENLAMGTFGYYTGADMFKMWTDEVQWYNWAEPGPNPISTAPKDAAVGHWTQIVWKNSAKVGCAYNRCAAGKLTGDESLYIVCHFDPYGNVVTVNSGADPSYAENVGKA